MSDTSTETRAVDTTLDIEAPADAVWEALTNATELERWFPLDAKATGGVGGRIELSWGEYWKGTHDIEIWEPGEHLRTSWPVGNEVAETPEGEIFEAPTDEQGTMADLAVDYFIEAKEGTSTLRLVQSGFGRGALWDDWYDGIRRGWAFELESLRHYLENHRGTDRHVAWARRSVERQGVPVFDAVFGRDGLFPDGSFTDLAPGEPYSLMAFDGTPLQGKVVVNEPGGQFAGTVDGLNNALFHVESFGHADKQEISIWLATWGVDAEHVASLGAVWRAHLETMAF